MNDKEYNALPGIRRSDLWFMSKTPAHFQFHMQNPEESPALAFGSAAHKYILERETFFDEYAVMPQVDKRTKAGKELIEAFKTVHADQTHISIEDFNTIIQMDAALKENSDIEHILSGHLRCEMPFTWTDPETGEMCKCKADILTEIDGELFIIDYKTTASCSDGSFESSARRYGYDFQSGFYTEGIEFCTMEKHRFAFIAQEKTAPYLARLYVCDEGFVNAGKRKFHELLRKYHTCKESDEWKGYETEYLYAEEYE